MDDPHHDRMFGATGAPPADAGNSANQTPQVCSFD